MDPRRPALRRHRRRSAATCSSAAGCASRPRSTSRMQAQAEAAVAAILPDPNGPDASLVVDRGGHRLRAGDGRRPRLLRHQPRSPSSTWPPRGPARPARRSSRSCWPPRSPRASTRSTADLGAGVHHDPDGENAEPWRPCNYGGGGGGTVTIAEGTVRSYNTLYAQLVMRVGAKEAMEGATRYGIMSPLENVPVRRARAATTSPPWTWRRPTPPSPTAASRCRPCSSPGSPGPTAPCSTPSSTSRRRCSRPAWSTPLTSILEQVDPARHRHPGQARPAGRGQDRHHRRQQGRLVRRATPRSSPPRCGSASPSSAPTASSSRCARRTRRSRSPAGPTRPRSGSGS